MLILRLGISAYFQLDLMILEVFSYLNNSVILCVIFQLGSVKTVVSKLYFTTSDRDKWPSYLKSSFGRISSVWVLEVLAVKCSGVCAALLSTWIKAFPTVLQSYCVWSRAWQVKQNGVIHQPDILQALGTPLTLDFHCKVCIITISGEL